MNLEGRKIKVVQVIADSAIGGGPKHVLGLLEHLDKDKFEVFLICPHGYLLDEAKKLHGIKIYPIRFKSKFDLASALLFRQTIDKIKSSNDPFGPLIVHVHGPRASFLTRLVRMTGVRYVYTEHIYDSTYHLANRFNEWIQKYLLKCANYKTDAIIAVSNSVKDFLIASHMVPENRIQVIPNGIDDKQVSKSASQLDSKGNITIGTIGTLNALKGQKYLIDAFYEIIKEFPGAKLEIIGEGPERKNLKSQISNLKINEKITLLGRVEEPEKHMKYWNVFALPSLAETFGISILEAYRAGIPVVASEVGGIPDIITHGANGLLVKPGRSKDLADKIKEILKDEKLATKLVSYSQDTLEKYSWKRIIKEIEGVYFRLI